MLQLSGPIAAKVWEHFNRLCGVIGNNNSIMGRLQSWWKHNPKVRDTILFDYFPSFILWSIWKARCKCKFENKEMKVDEICEDAKTLFIENSVRDKSITKVDFNSMQIVTKNSKSKKNKVSLVKWLLPPSGFIKLNTDSSFLSHNNESGIGGIFRDEHGDFITGFQYKIKCRSSLEAKAKAILRGITDFKFQNLIVESDSLQLINIIIKKVKSPWNLRNICNKITNIIEKESYQVVFVCREGTQCTDLLAKEGQQQNLNSSSITEFNRKLMGLVSLEKKGINYVRERSERSEV